MRIKTLETFGSYAVKLFEEVLRNVFGDPNDQRSNEQRVQISDKLPRLLIKLPNTIASHRTYTGQTNL